MKDKIQSLWIGKELSKLEQLSIKSFLDHGHDFILYTYGQVAGVPPGTTIKEANEIIPSGKIFKYNDYNSYAGFANLFRYKLLLEKGGIWVDTDIICLKPFDFNEDHVIASEAIKYKPTKFFADKIVKATCSVIKAPPGSKIMKYCYQVAKAKDPHKLTWGETGPNLINHAVIKREMTKYVADPHDFCPISWWEWAQFIHKPLMVQMINKILPFKHVSFRWYHGPLRAQLANKLKITFFKPYAYHFWNEMWRRNNIDKNERFPKYSIYEKLKRKHNT